MSEAVLAALGLGIAGVDPLGAVLLMTAIAANFTRSRIIFFSTTVFLSAVVAGTLLSVAGAGFISSIKDLLPVATSSVWLVVNLIIAAIILVWIIKRKLNENKPEKPIARRKLSKSYYAIVITGILFGAGSVLDPTFLASISLAAQTDSLITIIVMHTIWVLVSQIMLFGLFVAYLNGKHEKVIIYSRMQYRKHKALLQNILYIAAIAAFLFLGLDSVNYVVRGEYLINL